MVKDTTELARWSWYTMQLLNWMDEDEVDAPQCLNSFLKTQGFASTNNFRAWNQSSVLMGLYGLFVIPKEAWRNLLGDDKHEKVIADRLISEDFSFQTRNTFREHPDHANIQPDTFLRRFRNSLAHASFTFDSENEEITFRNHDQGVLNFESTNNLEGLTNFLAEVGKFFINEIGQ